MCTILDRNRAECTIKIHFTHVSRRRYACTAMYSLRYFLCVWVSNWDLKIERLSVRSAVCVCVRALFVWVISMTVLALVRMKKRMDKLTTVCAQMERTNQRNNNNKCSDKQQSATKPIHTFVYTWIQSYMAALACVCVIMADIVSPGMLTWDTTTSTSSTFFFLSAFHFDCCWCFCYCCCCTVFAYRISFQLYYINVNWPIVAFYLLLIGSEWPLNLIPSIYTISNTIN